MPQVSQNDVQVPHFDLPFRFGGVNGGAVVNEQDTDDDIVACIKAILAFPIGSREDEPDFGVPDLLFRQRNAADIAVLLNAIEAWEPRTSLVITEQDSWDEFVQMYQISVRTREEG